MTSKIDWDKPLEVVLDGKAHPVHAIYRQPSGRFLVIIKNKHDHHLPYNVDESELHNVRERILHQKKFHYVLFDDGSHAFYDEVEHAKRIAEDYGAEYREVHLEWWGHK